MFASRSTETTPILFPCICQFRKETFLLLFVPPVSCTCSHGGQDVLHFPSPSYAKSYVNS